MHSTLKLEGKATFIQPLVNQKGCCITVSPDSAKRLYLESWGHDWLSGVTIRPKKGYLEGFSQ